ncbi:MAG TPA: HTTM domain-containing protein [Chryseosolibacter sp.]
MKDYFQRYTPSSTLAVFRIVLGALMFFGIARFWANGWIEELYVLPKHFFPFYGFEFVRPLGEFTYVLFAVCAISSLLVALGLFYRVAIVLLFTSFTYIELIDKSTYLNHYYFISMVCLLMIFLPAHVRFSLDAWRDRTLAKALVPQWTVDAVKLLVCIVYVYAGLAKINSDWLLNAQPLRIWLPAKNDLPIVGPLFSKVWVAYVFSWMGCLYDLTIPFLLLNRSTRLFAYAGVIVFHVITAILFPIGMFPYLMIGTALIFFSPAFHTSLLNSISKFFRFRTVSLDPGSQYTFSSVGKSFTLGVLVIFFSIQLTTPWRHVLYPDEVFWTEEGYRFSWRVMLMEKAGYAEFTVKDRNGDYVKVNNSDFLTPLQEKMMASQPDMMLQYAHILREYYKQQGFESPQVYVDSYVTVNGRLGKPLVDATTDLAQIEDTFAHKSWLLPFGNDIKGL